MTDSLVPPQTNNSGTTRSIQHIPLWIAIVVILGALLTLTGAILSKANPTFITNGNPMTETARVYADYMFARNLALAVMLLMLLAIRARRMLAGFMVLIALIQMIDVADDLIRGAFLLVPGLVVFAIIFVIGARQLFGEPIWKSRTWRD